MSNPLPLQAAAVLLGAGVAASASAQTWVYDADSQVLPNAAGQPFEGAQAVNTGSMAVIDTGGGDFVWLINSFDSNTSPRFQQGDTPGPASNQWDVDNTTGYSTLWNVQVDPNTPSEEFAAQLITGDGVIAPLLQIVKPTAGSNIQLRLSDLSGGPVASKIIGNPEAFHTYRLDVQNGTANVYLDDYAFPILSSNNVAGAFDFIRVGDGTSNNDTRLLTQSITSYQGGLAPLPVAPDATSFVIMEISVN